MRAAGLLAAAALLSASPAGAYSELEAARGKALFDRPWTAAGGLGPAGLGPLFNARSCAECHPAGGRGDPAGPALVLRLAPGSPLGRQLQTRAVKGIAAEGRPEFLSESREVTLGDGTAVTLRRPRPAPDGSLRLAPSLRGAALLARVPRTAVLAGADPVDRDGDGVRGIPGPGVVGRTAAEPTLAGQVADALALDMGVATWARPGAAGDCTASQADCLTAAGADPVEAGATVLQDLAAYLEAHRPLPAGSPRPAGEAAFANLGCAACHRPSFTIPSDPAVTGTTTETIRPYTDLLLHDLGDDMADGTTRTWRTAPLWGLRDGGPYLHDGRAASLPEAILWHGGEATAARERFRAAGEEERAALVALLSHL